MTKRYFEAFAQEIATSNLSVEERVAMAYLIAVVAHRFNPRFDRARFFRAAGLPDLV